MIERIVVIGAGHAGGRFCERVRAEGYGGSLVLIGDEPYEPYERPPLSKDVLLGRTEPGAAKVIAQPFAALGIDWMKGCRAVALDRASRRVFLDDRTSITYDRLVLATGVRPRPAPFPGANLDGVHTLRTARDALALREALMTSGRMLIVGGGFIGLEAAAAAVERGWQVTVLERAPACLTRVIPPTSIVPIMELHAAKGVTIECGVDIEALEGHAKVSAVALKDGRRLGADLVLLGIGSVANDELARGAGLPTHSGVLVDAAMQTVDPSIFAIGDVAVQDAGDGNEPQRIESVDNAERQAAIAASTILGNSFPAASPPWFWTDQFDLNVQIIGEPHASHGFVARNDAEGKATHHFYHAGDRLTGAVLFNAGRDRRTIAKMLARGARVDLARLSNSGCDLKAVAV
jgi:3-phenylpropionate/trans-cinnamate dioxygenase ferredoxin reductase subunit